MEFVETFLSFGLYPAKDQRYLRKKFSSNIRIVFFSKLWEACNPAVVLPWLRWLDNLLLVVVKYSAITEPSTMFRGHMEVPPRINFVLQL